MCKFNYALYELKEAFRTWYDVENLYHFCLGLIKSVHGNNLYYLKANNKILILTLYVDDLFNIGDYCHILSWLKTQLTQKYEMNNLGNVSKYFAFKIEQS